MNDELFKNSRKAAIDRNVAKRQALKKKWDRHCKYSVEDQDLVMGVDAMFAHERQADFSKRDEENWVRMLDEGTVVDGDGWCYAVIEKGVLKDFFDNLPDNFEGYIDKDHIYAIRLGSYTKKDMRLVPLGDDRYGIDINVKLDDDYYATRDLLKQDEHRAVSVEMGITVDEFGIADKITGDKKQGKYLVPIINKVNILGYAVCENPKNANSIKDDLLDKASVEGDLGEPNLEGDNMNEDEKKLALEAEADADTQKATEQGDQADEDRKADEDLKAPDTSAGADEGNEGEGEGNEGDQEDKAADDDAEAEKGLEQLEAAINELRAKVDAQAKTITEKDEKIAELENQLAAKAEKAKLSTADKVAQLLNLATSATPSAAEGSKVDTPSNDLADRYAADDAEWDAVAEAYKY